VAQLREIDLADLRLDALNRRHDPQDDQRDIIAALLRGGESKLIELARDIAEHGLNPMDAMLVTPYGRNAWVTLEGNRRLAALKLLDNPGLVDDHHQASAFQKLAKGARHRVTTVQCAVVKSRDDAEHWLQLRHIAGHKGAGVVPWSAEQQHRFAGRVGTDVHAGVTFVDAVQAAYGADKDLLRDLEKVRLEKITTLGRLVRDPDFRSALGILMDGDGIRWHYSSAALLPIIRQLVSDLATQVNVSSIKSKDLRRSYIAKLPKIDAAAYVHQASSLKAVKKAQGGKSPTGLKVDSPGKHLLTGVGLSKVSARTRAIATELRGLDINRYPNACGVLLRVVLELAVDDFLTSYKIKLAQELKDKIRRAAHVIDPTDKDPRYQAVRSGLSDGTSVMAATTMHAFVHNKHYHPTPTDLRQIASNYGPFIQALDAALP
jgi:hypothetical protein